ncbi:haloacid dehalogenase type II [Methylobacterium mesophilicum]
MLKLDPTPKVITFDCYGTLVQWHRAVREAAKAILSKHASGDDLEKRSTTLADQLRSRAVLHQDCPPFQDYKAVLRLSLDEVLAEAGFQGTEDDHQTLLSILRRIEPHPEVPAALERLRDRYKLAIISNTDDDLIAETVQAIGVPMDFVITAQQARAYKPDHRLFQYAYDTMGVAKEETIHVGMGQVTDMKVCHELGIRSVWIDRVGEPLDPHWQPDAVLNDLTELPQLLSAL